MANNDIVAGMILASRFCVSGSDEFNNYIEYIDREQAVRAEHFTEFSLYNDYMANPDKTSALFTADCDRLSDEQKSQLKNSFSAAQKSGSLMWQNVISFDNRWLCQNGFYNAVTGELKEDKIVELTRSAMDVMAEKENMTDTIIWSAAIHYNTDNIHIHIAAVEYTPTRDIIRSGVFAGQQRGKLKLSTLRSMKTAAMDKLFDREKEHIRITNLIRQGIVAGTNKDELSSDRKMRRQIECIISRLPKNKSLWKYNNRAVKPVQPLINELTNMYIRKYHKKEYRQLTQKISEEQQFLTEAYGKGSEKAAKYSENKMIDLYTRMGNTILDQLKDYRVTPNRKSKYVSEKNRRKPQLNRSDDLYRLKKALKKDWESIKNQQYFESLQRDIANGAKEESI